MKDKSEMQVAFGLAPAMHLTQCADLRRGPVSRNFLAGR